MSYILDAGNENSKVVHITSTDATHSYDTSGAYLKYDLETPIQTPPNQDTLVSLYSAVIPYSFYNIRKDINDRVYFTSIKSGSAEHRFFVIPQGSEWFFDFVGLGSSIPINEAHVCLGLPAKYEGNIASFIYDGSKYVFETPLVPDVNGATHSVNIRTNLASKGCIDSQSKSFSTILGTIPIDVNFGGVIFFRPADAIHKIVITSKDIKNIVIRLTDDRDRLLDLNGLAFNVTILIDHIKHGRNIQRRRVIVDRPLEEKPKRGRPKKDKRETISRELKKDIPIPLIN